MTSDDIFLYEESTGKIKKIEPSNVELPTRPDPEYKKKKSRVYYICEPRLVDKIKRDGRMLSDIAVVCNKALGYNDILITRLVWGGDPHIEVRFCANIINPYY